ncbi:MAG: hypothetical protein EPO68_16700 [Planctomycetota bacterium]|nr:MAG: hypothetical protein EPO68_16700 [Planctomycetota bacterium]
MRALCAALVCCGAVVAQAKPPKRVDLRWQGKAYAADKLPAELASGARDAWKQWSAWAHEHGYKLELTGDQHLLLAYPKQQSSAASDLTRIDAAAKIFERLAPLPDRATMPGAFPPGLKEAIGEPPSALPEGLSPADFPACDRATAVLLKARTVDDYEAVVRAAVKLGDGLEGWQSDALAHRGFVLPEPLCAAWISTGAPGMEEWSPEAELVHRVAQLLLMRRFGPQPWWLTVGLAWNVEMEQIGGVYCFPYRDGFVGVGEHTGWDKNLAAAFKARKKEALEASELFGLVRGGFDSASAEIAWGCVGYLASQKPGALSLLLADLRTARLVKGRVELEDGTWTLARDFELPKDEQLRLLHKRAGNDVRTELSAWFAKGLPGRKPAK